MGLLKLSEIICILKKNILQIIALSMVVGVISGAINDAYLQANGTEGTRSYGLVVDLAVAFFHAEIEN